MQSPKPERKRERVLPSEGQLPKKKCDSQSVYCFSCSAKSKREKSLQQGIRAEMVIILLCCECVGFFFFL